MRKLKSNTLFNFIFFMCAFSLALSVQAHDFSFTGKASDIETGELLYTEQHYISLDARGGYFKSLVRYVAADGSLIARKSLDFETSQTAPILDFEYQNYALQYGSEYREGMFVLKTDASESRKESMIDLEGDKPFIVDGGFDRLLVKRWDSLLSGSVQTFDFLAITRASTIEFELSVVAQSADRVRFQIEPSSWVIGFLVEPIFLEYDRESRLLMRYEGLTNIAFSQGSDNVVAVIDYTYDEKARPLALKRIDFEPAG